MALLRDGLLLFGLVASGTLGYRAARPSPTLERLALSADAGGPPGQARASRVWFVFRPQDCATGSARVDSLNALHARPDLDVVGVMIDGPTDAVQAATLVASFGARFPVVADADGRWARAVARASRSTPVHALRRPNRLVAVLSHEQAMGALQATSGTQPQSDAVSGRALSPVGGRLPRRVLAELRPAARGGTGLRRPVLPVYADGRVHVFDYGDRRVKAYDESGRAVWAYPGDGAAGTPFENPTSLQVDPRGRVIVWDSPAQTVIRLSPAGALIDRVQLSAPVHRLTVSARGALWGFDVRDTTVLGIRFDSAGAVAARLPLPEVLREVPPMSRESRVAALPGADSVVIAYLYGGQLGLLDLRTGGFRLAPGVEPLRFPAVVSWTDGGQATFQRVAPDAVDGMKYVTADENFIYVLFAGSTEHAGRVVDRYARGTAEYRGSYLLPERVDALVRTRRGFATVQVRPEPRLTFWELPGQ